MKKILFIAITLSLLFLGKMSAQPIQNYSFESKIGTYEAITGGTVVWSGADSESKTLANRIFLSATESSTEKVTDAAGIPIEFNFTFDNKIANKFVIGSHGLVFLGKDQITADPVNSSTVLDAADAAANWVNGRIDVLGIAMTGTNSNPSGVATTEISYKVIGTAPNRVLVVQFKDVQLNRSNNTTPDYTTVNFQIRLQETTNKVEYVFTGWVATTTIQKNIRTALKGSYQGDAYGRYSATGGSWLNTSPSPTGALAWRDIVVVPDNLTFTFIPPADLVTPATQPTGLNLTSTSTNVSGSFTATTADRYLVLLSSSSTIPNPVDGAYYKGDDYIGIGDSIGNARVIAYGTETTFASRETLFGATTYYVQVYAVNTNGGFGPKYNTTTPLAGQINTAPDQPGELKILSMDYNNITLSAATNNTNQIIIARTDIPELNSYSEIQKTGQFGIPSGALAVGDEIPGGGTVIYKGNSTDLISQEGLNDNTVYHFRSWSVSADNVYSSTVQNADTLTWGKVPYVVDWSKHEGLSLPLGWESDSPEGSTIPFQITKGTTAAPAKLYVQVPTTIPNLANGVTHSVTTQPILLKEGANEIEIDLAFHYYLGRSWVVYNTDNWTDLDALEFQLDNGDGFTTIYTISKANGNVPTTAGTATAPVYAKVRIPFYNFDGEQVKLRLRWTTGISSRVYINTLKINEKECDNVVTDIAATNVVGHNALVSWTAPAGDASADIRYRVAGTEEWSEPIAASTNPFSLTTLPLKSNIELQVRSNCSPRSKGAWSEPFTFFSGYEIPFSENFDTTENDALPGGWKINGASITQGVTNHAIALDYNAALNDSIFLPLLDLGDGSANYKFDFKLQQLQGTLSALPADDYLAVIISEDGGVTFSELKKFQAATFVAGNYTLPLAGHTGVVQLGFYAQSATLTAITAGIDDVAVLPTCPPAENVTVSDVAEWSAKVTWEGVADEWLVFVRKTGETEVNYTKQTANELILDDLIPATGYEVGITQSCGNQDTAKVIIVSFITLPAAPCEAVKNIVKTPYQGSAELTWESDAANFNFKYRRVGGANWTESALTTNSIRLEDLLAETEYEFSIQAICSNAYGDQSEWVDGTFTTRPVSCITPTGITFSSVTHKYATVSWTGDAANYEVAYRTGDVAWTTIEVESKTTTLTGLVPSTAYSVRIRSICTDDVSAWATTTFNTTEITCLIPTNLQATGITEKSVALSWDADEENLTWNLRYREGAETSWTIINEVAEKSYSLDNLKDDTAYLWTVRGACEGSLISNWATQSEFTTERGNGINTIGSGNLNVFVSNRVLNILNPDNSYIERVQLYDAKGVILKDFVINSTDNVLIPTAYTQSAVIVKVFGKNTSASFKVLVK